MTGHSLRLDHNHYPHIAYGSDHLYHAWYGGSVWKYEVVDSSPGVGLYASLAFDMDGKAGISYLDSYNHVLKFARWNGSAWSHEPLTPSSQGLQDNRQPVCSIKIGDGNNPTISYFDRISRHLTLAHKVGTSWQIDILDANGDTGTHNSLAIWNGIPFIAYYHASNKDLMFVQWQP